MNNISKSHHVDLIFKVKFNDNQVKTIAPLQSINKTSLNELLDLLLNRIDLLSDAYKTTPITDIIFYYIVMDGEITPNITKNNKTIPNYHIFFKNKLPIAYKPEEYGSILLQNDNLFIISNGKAQIILEKSIENKNIKYDVKYLKNNKVIFEWIDRLIEPNYLVRSIGSSVYHFIDGELTLIRSEKKLAPLNKQNQINSLTIKY